MDIGRAFYAFGAFDFEDPVEGEIGRIMEDFIFEKQQRKPVDIMLLLIILLLAGIGLSMLFSAAYPNALRIGKSPHYFFRRQLIMFGIGTAGAMFISCVPMSSIKKAIPAFVITSIALTFATAVFGTEIQGARRWMIIGNFSFQPSEFLKIAVVLYLASDFSKKKEKNELYSYSHSIVVISLCSLIIFFQTDLSTAVFILTVSLAIFFFSDIKGRYIVVGLLAVFLLLVIFIWTKDYRMNRISAFLDPESDPAGKGYQVLNSMAALSDGGFYGRGIGNGNKYKFGALPEAHSDFIFAIVGEELGFVGVFIVIALFVGFAVRGYMIAFGARDKFGFFLAFGITTSIFYQALINMAVVGKMIPTTGISLPFFSHGGSSLLATLLECGLLLNLSRNIDNVKRGHEHY